MRGTLSEDQVYDLNPVEGRERLIEGMDLVLRALTDPQPFSWEGRYYRYRTVSVWPKPVQQPLPPAIVATRSDDTVKYAADNHLGLGISYDGVDSTAQVVEKYTQWCQEAGWQPTPDEIVYRGGICLAETDRQAQDFLDGLQARGVERGLAIGASLTRAVVAARAGEGFDPRVANGASSGGQQAQGRRPLLNFVGGPDTVARQLKEYHDNCGVGVVDLAFQQPGKSHQQVMEEIELFGREVLPRIREF